MLSKVKMRLGVRFNGTSGDEVYLVREKTEMVGGSIPLTGYVLKNIEIKNKYIDKVRKLPKSFISRHSVFLTLSVPKNDTN